MYVSVINTHGREDEVNTDKVNYSLTDRGTLFVGQAVRPRPLTADLVQAGKLVTHLLSDPAFADMRDVGRGYVLNLENLQRADFNVRSGTIFINFSTGAQIKLPIAKQAALEQALAAYLLSQGISSSGTPVQTFSTRWQRVRFA